MNTRRVAALLRELADELERGDAPAAPRPANDAPAPAARPKKKPATREGFDKAARLLRRAGVRSGVR